jgi:hypothetical protein
MIENEGAQNQEKGYIGSLENPNIVNTWAPLQ